MRTPARPRVRRMLPVVAAAAVLAAVLAALLPAAGDDEPAGSRAAAATPTATPTAAAPPGEAVPPPLPTPAPTGPTEDVDQLPPALPEVPLDAPAEVGNGIAATVARVEPIEGTGTGPGNLAGPALRVTVRITNGTPEPVALGGVSVNLATGADRTPAPPLADPSARPFDGTVAPGGTAEGVYVFTVPVDARGTVTVEVGYQAGAPLLLFTGPAA